ncbi:hypothetical protein [Cylindrospermum stagnale]|uniref:hypothetical protein n=1 Tax=Cylindrospermum stagnale TaxID=142864 RepID=UPI0002DC025E|nr:hypothetical protein [Cylindrospermum stagnale]
MIFKLIVNVIFIEKATPEGQLVRIIMLEKLVVVSAYHVASRFHPQTLVLALVENLQTLNVLWKCDRSLSGCFAPSPTPRRSRSQLLWLSQQEEA